MFNVILYYRYQQFSAKYANRNFKRRAGIYISGLIYSHQDYFFLPDRVSRIVLKLAWTVDSGLWTVDYWTADSRQWAVGSGQWTVDSGQWTLDHWTADSRPWTVEGRQCTTYRQQKEEEYTVYI